MRSQYRNLIIIGNGFDLWQGLNTSYDSFKEFYYKNVKHIVIELGIETSLNIEGKLITPVEMIYGDIFNPSELPSEFFWNFEANTALIDDQSIINYFNKTDTGLYELQETIQAAIEILQKAFSKWIQSIAIEPKESGYAFDDSCFFINFNYTDTLEKRFGVDNSNVYHIHGEATDPESILFGHSTHPEMAFPELMEQNLIRTLDGKKSLRLRGLYLAEDALYSTDKSIQDNIDDLCLNMGLQGVHIEDITDIYVLGHSFSDTDYEYIDFLVKNTQQGYDYNKSSALWKVQNLGFDSMSETELLEWIQLNILYATQHRNKALGKDNISFPKEEAIERSLFGKNNIITDGNGVVHDVEDVCDNAKEAVYKRFILEQAGRTKDVIEDLCLIKNNESLPSDCLSVLGAIDYIDGGHDPRLEDAKWHISYYSDEGKEQIEQVMSRTGCRRYELFSGIDGCIERFHK